MRNIAACKLIPNKLICLLILSFLFCIPIQSQSSLSPGDIVFTGYNADDPASNDIDQFSFLLLVDIQANTEIYFTDFGWTGSQFQNTPVTWRADIDFAIEIAIDIVATFDHVKYVNIDEPPKWGIPQNKIKYYL